MLGIDAERNAPLREGVWEQVAHGSERELRGADAGGGYHLDAALFSAKEAIFKAWYPLARRWLGFGDAELAIESSGTFTARLLVPGPEVSGVQLRELAGRWTADGGRGRDGRARPDPGRARNRLTGGMAAQKPRIPFRRYIIGRMHHHGSEGLAGGDRDAIAVIGDVVPLAGRPNPDAYWELLREGRDAIIETPAEPLGALRARRARRVHAGPELRWDTSTRSTDSTPASSASPRGRPRRWTRSSASCWSSPGRLSRMPASRPTAPRRRGGRVCGGDLERLCRTAAARRASPSRGRRSPAPSGA